MTSSPRGVHPALCRTRRKLPTLQFLGSDCAPRERSPLAGAGLHWTTVGHHRKQKSYSFMAPKALAAPMGQAERFVTAHSTMHNLFNLGRHLVRAQHYRELRVSAFGEWRRAVA
jgi:hypothetical protein